MKTILSLFFSIFTGVLCAQTSKPAVKEKKNAVIATVHGKNITAKEKGQLQGIIWESLLKRFAEKQNIEPTAEELATFLLKMEGFEKKRHLEYQEESKNLKAELQKGTLSEEEKKEKESRLQTIDGLLESTRKTREQIWKNKEEHRTSKLQLARSFVTTWKINKALHTKYGGRVIFQQVGAEPLDAYRDFLKEQEKSGAFKIFDEKYEAKFWKYFTDDKMHTFYSKEEGDKFINTPWWMLQMPSKE